MKSLPTNALGLTDEHLEKTRTALLSIIQDKKAEPLDRIRAAKEIRGWANDIWKWNADRNQEASGGDMELEKPRRSSGWAEGGWMIDR